MIASAALLFDNYDDDVDDIECRRRSSGTQVLVVALSSLLSTQV